MIAPPYRVTAGLNELNQEKTSKSVWPIVTLSRCWLFLFSLHLGGEILSQQLCPSSVLGPPAHYSFPLLHLSFEGSDTSRLGCAVVGKHAKQKPQISDWLTPEIINPDLKAQLKPQAVFSILTGKLWLLSLQTSYYQL